MDEFDSFYQQLDSKQLLDTHGPELRDEARELLAQSPDQRFGGTILTPDSKEAETMRQAITAMTGQRPPPGLMVGLCPRAMIEPALMQHVGEEPRPGQTWREEPGQPQFVLPVLVATRDGVRFGFFGLGEG
jgi:hypothetical protein